MVPNTRDRILEAAYALFYRKGFARVSVDAISERAGVTKKTVYYYFDSKDAVAAEVFNVQHRHLMREFQSWLDAGSINSFQLIEGIFSRLYAWANKPDWLGSGFTRISVELADMPGHPARRAAKRNKHAVERRLKERLETMGLEDARQLASQIMILIEGGMSLALIHGDPDYIKSAMKAAMQLVECHGCSG